MKTLQLAKGQLTMSIGLNYGNGHPDPVLRGSAMSVSKALDAVVPAMADAGFIAYTVRETLGFWEGKPEKSLEVVLLGADETASAKFFEAAERIRKGLFQDAVLVTQTVDVQATLICREEEEGTQE